MIYPLPHPLIYDRQIQMDEHKQCECIVIALAI